MFIGTGKRREPEGKRKNEAKAEASSNEPCLTS